MALAVASSSSSTAISARSFSSEIKAPESGSFRMPSQVVKYSSQRWSSVKAVNAQPKRNDSIVPLAATVVAPEEVEKVEVEDYEQLAKELESASPLQIMDKALEKFGNDIAIA